MLLTIRLGAFQLPPDFDVDQYAHTAWKVRDGSFKDSIAAIAQTPDGYLWLGTQFGLLRFDGVRHTVWQPPDGQQLPSINIRSLLAARDGRLWIGTQLGVASWKDGTLTAHPEISGQAGAFAEDRDGTIWVTNRYPPPGRLCAFRKDGTQCYGERGEFGKRASSVYEDAAGQLWVGAETGLWRWKPGQPTHYPLADFESSNGLVQGDNGALVIAERNGMKLLVNDTIVEYLFPEEVRGFQPSYLLRDRSGALWIGTFDRGLVHVREGRVDLFSQTDGLSGNYIRDIFEDREGNIWVGTDNGLDRFRDTVVTTISVNQGLSHTTPWSVLTASDGSVWVGTLDGLNRLQGSHITIYRNVPRGPEAVAARAAPRAPGRLRAATGSPRWTVREVTDPGLPDVLIHSLFEDDRQRIWVSTRAGLAYFENDRFTPVPGIPGGVHAIAGDAAGTIWISEDEHLFQVVAGRIESRTSWTRLGRKVPAMPMIADPKNGGLWLAFRDGTGLAYFKDDRIVASYGVAQGLGRGMVAGLRLDADGTVWAATEGGLSRVKRGRIHTLASIGGLPCDGVHWAIEDRERSLWLYTACGLARIPREQLDSWGSAADEGREPPTLQPMVFDSSDGVRIHAAAGGYTPQVGRSPDGRIWFLPWDGVSVVDVRRIPFNRLMPPVHIEQIIADGRKYAPAAGLRLPALARDVSIDYTAATLVAPEKVRFRYKLEGQDPEWREVLNERRVQYSNLGPGNYRFRVLASNNSGVWNEAGASLDFVILPAYYQTTWFRALSGLMLVSVLGIAYRLRIGHLHREERKMRQVVDSIPAIAGIARPDGSNEYLNRRWVEFTGLSAAGTAGSGWQVAIHPDDRDRYLAKWADCLARGEQFELESRLRSARGYYRWFLVRAVPVRDKHGTICNFYVVMTDIEDRKHAERELERLSGRLIHAQEEERRRIGRELHDDISQSLGLLAIKIDQLSADPATPPPVCGALAVLKQDTGTVAADVHRLSHQLHSSTLDYLGLVPALRRLVTDFSSRHGIAVAFTHDSLVSQLPPQIALCLFRIAQETLNNVAKHSQARSATVRVGETSAGVHLTVQDDGVGFDVAGVEIQAGLGFVSMRERLRPLHGAVRVDSVPGKGTRIDVHVPIVAASAVESTESADVRLQ